MADSLEFAISRFAELISQENSELVSVRVVFQIAEVLRELQSARNRRLHIADELRELAAKTMVLCSSFEHLLEDHLHRASRAGKCCFPFVACYPKRRCVMSARKMVLDFRAEVKLLQDDLVENDFDYSGQDLVTEKKSWLHTHHRTRIWEGKMDMMINSMHSNVDQHLQVIVISGAGGVGKTALARQFFDHEKIGEWYPTRCWIDSQADLDSKVHFDKEESRVLLVLDGICTPDKWKDLRNRILSWNNCRVTVLMTTRIREIVRTEDGREWNLHLGSLEAKQECKLLLEQGGNVPVHLNNERGEDLRKKIVSYCGGLPLMLASFLRSMSNKHTLEEWDEAVSKRLMCTSIIKRLEATEVQTTVEVLASSFDNLQPYILKLIFLYMGVLQVNLRVEVQRLYLFYLADEIISSERPIEATLADFTKNYANELAKKAMVDLDEEEGLKYCQLSEHMRDLSLSKSVEESFFKFIEYDRGSRSVPELLLSSSRGSVDRVAINLDEYEEECDFPFEDDQENSLVRVLIFSVRKDKKVWSRKFPSFVKFKRLKILHFDGLDFEQTMLPEGIETAVHLRYLGFKDCVVGKLPTSIGNLAFLYILDLRVEQSADSSPMLIPNVLWKLKKLRHLFLPMFFKPHGDCKKLRIIGLTELETITNFNTWNFYVKDLLTLQKLQHLASTVDGSLEEIEYIVKLMEEKEKEKKENGDSLYAALNIRNFDCYSEKRHSVFRKLLACKSLQVLRFVGHLRLMPMHDLFSQNLTKIEFIDSELIDDPMKTLDKLPKLCELTLDAAFLGKEMACSKSGFTELRIMLLSNLLNVEKWTVESGAMPKLHTLAIRNCAKLKTLPERLKSLRRPL